MKKLKIILQSKYFLIGSLLITIIYILLFTKIIVYNSKYEINTNTIIGTILEYKIDGDKLSILLKGKEKINVNYYIKNESEKAYLNSKLKIGLKAKVYGEISIPSNNTIPNTFNYKKYLYNHRIYYTFSANKIEFGNHVSFLNNIKNWFKKRADNIESSSSYMHAFVLGDSSLIQSGAIDTYRNNGVTHLFAVSGMHISILILLVEKIFSKLKKKDIIITFFLMFYMFLVGFTASVVRASLFYIFLKLNKKLNLNLSNKMVLYILFIILVIINPFYIYDIGFLYSFTTSFGLILFSSKIKGNYIKTTFLVSFIAFIFSLPITIYNFYEFNLLTVLNNIIVVPLVSVIIFPFSLLTFVFPFLDSILKILISILEFINLLLGKISISVTVPKRSLIFIIIYYSIIYLIYKCHFKYTIFLILLILIKKVTPYLDSNSYIYFLDVGQGDSSIIVSSNMSDIIMIDTGGKISYEKETWQRRNKEFDLTDNIATFLKSIGATRIDLLIASHGDLDHIGYAKNLSNKIKIKRLMLNKNNKNELEIELIKKIKEVNTYNPKKIKMKNLNPDTNKDENDSSLVMYILINNYKFLFMGDAPIKVEENIINKYNLDIDFLKVGHHGSNTSSSVNFINKISPKYSIISVGKNNRYGHPNKEVLHNLNKSKIYRTDQDGSIKIKIKNNELDVKTYSP